MYLRDIQVGWFLGTRIIKRASIWTTLLIIAVMTLTFLNLVVVSGILIGLIEGSSIAYRKQYSADIVISNFVSKDYILETPRLLNILNGFPEVLEYTPRYIQGAKIQANYKNLTKPGDIPNEIGTSLIGINPEIEDDVTGLGDRIIAGEYLDNDDTDSILLGNYLTRTYSQGLPPSLNLLDNVEIGSKVRVEVNGQMKEFKVKGILKSKVELVSSRAFIVDREFRRFTGRDDYNLNEIAVRLKDGNDPYVIKNAINRSGVDKLALVQTWKETQGTFFDQISDTFGMLGNVISSIGLAVAFITVFIVIFINAITRRKYIGILKGIGITGVSIQIAYIVQSLFYAICGSVFGLFLLYGVIKPFIDRNPINFPFSDGILVATLDGTFIRIIIILIATLIAGYIPARIVIRQNTLDSILGR